MVKELKIDLDLYKIRKEDNKKIFLSRKYSLFLYQFKKLFYNLKKYNGVEICSIRVKETSKGFHIKIKINKDVSYEEQLLFQSFLLSDVVRELFNYCRYIADELIDYNFFSEKKEVYKLNSLEKLYESEEKITKRANKLLRRLISIINKLEDYKKLDGKYY